MSVASASQGAEPELKRRRREATSSLAAAAERRSLRFGAPAAAVDPLLALLFDVRRLEQRILDILGEVGVALTDIPAATHVDVSPNAVGDPTQPTSAPMPPEALRSGRSAQSAVDQYAESVLRETSPSPVVDVRSRAAVVESVLAWIDQSIPASVEAASATDAATSRRILAGLVAAQEEEDGAPLIVTSSSNREDSSSSTVIEPCRGKQRAQRKPALRFIPDTAAASEEKESMTCLGSFGAATVLDWGRYADGLSLAIAQMHPLLHGLCATSLSATQASHAKWVERSSRDTGTAAPVMPSCTTLKTNYEAVIRVSDALASCQREVRRHLLSLEESVESFGDEAVAVCRFEAQYWHQVRAFEQEYEALRAMKRRITHVQRSFQQEEGIPVVRRYKGHMAANAEMGDRGP